MGKRLAITNGPSNMDLAFSLFSGDRKERVPVYFVVQSDEERDQERSEEVFINMLARESGYPRNWLFSGYVVSNEEESQVVRANGYFNTRTKSGWIEFDS